jgi:hypothetical protein
MTVMPPTFESRKIRRAELTAIFRTRKAAFWILLFTGAKDLL